MSTAGSTGSEKQFTTLQSALTKTMSVQPEPKEAVAPVPTSSPKDAENPVSQTTTTSAASEIPSTQPSKIGQMINASRSLFASLVASGAKPDLKEKLVEGETEETSEPKSFAERAKRFGQKAKEFALKTKDQFDALPLWAKAAIGFALCLLIFLIYVFRFKVSDYTLFTNWNTQKNVAFIGSAYLYTNDIPRVMEAISDDKIHQNSVIQPEALSLSAIIMRGNGVYGSWQTSSAVIDSSYVSEEGMNQTVIYDFGLCSVGQILEGYDQILRYGNNNAAYYDDGTNPCINDYDYYQYTEEYLYKNTLRWDHVVLSDTASQMLTSDDRASSIYSLRGAYAPMIKESVKTVPILVEPHAYFGVVRDDSGNEDLDMFTAQLTEAALEYQDAMMDVLPESQRPKIAHVGVAFLTVYKEKPAMWEKLFSNDGRTASAYGSFLFATVLYSTIYGHLPPRDLNHVEELFMDSRSLSSDPTLVEFPNSFDAAYLRNVAKRVSLNGHAPRKYNQKLKKLKAIKAQADAEAAAYAAAKAYALANCQDVSPEGECRDDDHNENDNGPDRM